MTAMSESEDREALVRACRHLDAAGLNRGTSGNVSLRRGAVVLISPSAVPPDRLSPGDIAAMPIDGAGAWSGPLRPSTEWRFHLDILRARPELGAVVHCHPPFGTALAIARRPIPACHYMVALFGGADVRCAPYALFGSAALSTHALQALEGRRACLLANHGAIVCAPGLEHALRLADELETLAAQYCRSLPLGPVLLDEAEIAAAVEAFASYRPHAADTRTASTH